MKELLAAVAYGVAAIIALIREEITALSQNGHKGDPQ